MPSDREKARTTLDGIRMLDYMTSVLQQFVNSAVKTVTNNDRTKSYIGCNQDLVAVFHDARIVLSEEKPRTEVDVAVLYDDELSSVRISYYLSLRDGQRPPEPRMGLEIISGWLTPGDEFVVATDGEGLFAFRTAAIPLNIEEGLAQALPLISTEQLERRLAAHVVREPRTVQRTEYYRSPLVTELVLRRADGKCEYPECEYTPFPTVAGRMYLEVHHIHWLRDGGPDTVENAAALCPNCHRAQHHAADREERRSALLAAIRRLMYKEVLDSPS